MDDSSIVTLLQEGNNEAYKQMFIKYYAPLCEYASQYITDDEAEELIQELMLYIWENRRYLIVESSLKSYLFIAAKHRCLNTIKKQQYHRRIHSVLYEKLKDQFESPDYYLVNDLGEELRKAIKELPQGYRQTFAMSRLENHTNAEIARKLGVSVKTIEYRITQSLKILRMKLKEYAICP
jgi:RNA polymerase sigma-70 factor (ECF subfamily)